MYQLQADYICSTFEFVEQHKTGSRGALIDGLCSFLSILRDRIRTRDNEQFHEKNLLLCVPEEVEKGGVDRFGLSCAIRKIYDNFLEQFIIREKFMRSPLLYEMQIFTDKYDGKGESVDASSQ